MARSCRTASTVGLQYGIFFPMQGLGYLSQRGQDQVSPSNPDLESAWTLRLNLGIQY